VTARPARSSSTPSRRPSRSRPAGSNARPHSSPHSNANSTPAPNSRRPHEPRRAAPPGARPRPCADTNAVYVYDYAGQDPINNHDLDGQSIIGKFKKVAKKASGAVAGKAAAVTVDAIAKGKTLVEQDVGPPFMAAASYIVDYSARLVLGGVAGAAGQAVIDIS